MTDWRLLSLWCFLIPSAALAASDAEDDALMLADSTPEVVAAPVSDWRVFTEVSLGQVSLRQGNTPTTTSDAQRYSLDVLLDKTVAPGLRAVFADRLDYSAQSAGRGAQIGTINTLKEAYLSWQPHTNQVLDAGRISVRYGAAFGYNPTDFFRERANRTLVSVDPNSIRENRMGVAMLRAQTLWAGGSLTAILAPKLADAPNSAAWSPDLGSTNGRTRWMLAASHTLGPGLNPQYIIFGDDQQPIQLGLNLAALLNDATVAHVEWSGARMRSLAAQALPPSAAVAQDEGFRHRLAAGLTYTSAQKFSVTAELHYNGAAMNSTQWEALRQGAAVDYSLYRQLVQNRLELSTRQAAYLRANWQDVLMNNLDLAAMLRINLDDQSRMAWLEARYRWERAEMALQWQVNSGDASSDFGAALQQRNAQLQVRYFLK